MLVGDSTGILKESHLKEQIPSFISKELLDGVDSQTSKSSFSARQKEKDSSSKVDSREEEKQLINKDSNLISMADKNTVLYSKVNKHFVERNDYEAKEKVLDHKCCLCAEEINNSEYMILSCKHKAHNECICLKDDYDYIFPRCTECNTDIANELRQIIHENNTPNNL